MKEQRGFTLVEAVVAIGIMGFIMAGLFGLLSSSLQSWQRGRAGLEVQQTVRYAVDFIARDIAFAKTLTVTGGTKLVLTTDKYGVNDQQIEYSVDTTLPPWILYRQVLTGGGSRQPMTGGSTTAVSLANPSGDYATPFGGTPVFFIAVDANTVELNVAGLDYTAYTAKPAIFSAWSAYRLNTAARKLN